MIIKEKLIKEYPLTKQIKCPLECYEVVKRRYVIFLDIKINRNNMEYLAKELDEATKNICTEKRSLIVVGYTDEQFKKEDLFFYNGLYTCIVYYLINENNKEIYFNDQTFIFFLIGWKKIIKKFNEILNNYKKLN